MQRACSLGAAADVLLADYRSKRLTDVTKLAPALALYNQALVPLFLITRTYEAVRIGAWGARCTAARCSSMPDWRI